MKIRLVFCLALGLGLAACVNLGDPEVSAYEANQRRVCNTTTVDAAPVEFAVERRFRMRGQFLTRLGTGQLPYQIGTLEVVVDLRERSTDAGILTAPVTSVEISDLTSFPGPVVWTVDLGVPVPDPGPDFVNLVTNAQVVAPGPLGPPSITVDANGARTGASTSGDQSERFLSMVFNSIFRKAGPTGRFAVCGQVDDRFVPGTDNGEFYLEEVPI